MAARTLTETVTDTATGAEEYARIVRVVQRNTRYMKFYDKSNVVIPVRTETHPSPMKRSASNRQPGQSHTRTAVSAALTHEMATARYLIQDLADHVFGDIVSTGLARDILGQFVEDGFVKVFEGTRSDPLDPESDRNDIQHAIEKAFEYAVKVDCIRPGTQKDCEEPGTLSAGTKGRGKQTSSKGKGKKKEKDYSFRWRSFPNEPIDEDELVGFLNEITDRAFEFARPRLAGAIPKLNRRFATRYDKNHGMPLSYEPDGEDMRPDFLLLPAQAFSDDFKTVDSRYLNFTAARLVGEAKNKDLTAGVEQVQRYARGLKRAQPWVHYVLSMVITKDKAVFMRGEGSGVERLDLILSNGRGCIEFIRIFLGLALAEDVEIGQNPAVELKNGIRPSEVNNAAHRSVVSNIPTQATASGISRTSKAGMVAALSSNVIMSKTVSDTFPVSSRTHKAFGVRASTSITGSVSTASTRGASLAPNVLCNSFISASSERGTLVASDGLPISSRTRSASASSRCSASVTSTSRHARITSVASRHDISITSKAHPDYSSTPNPAPSRRLPHVSASSCSSKRTYSEIGGDSNQERKQKKCKVTKTIDLPEEQMVFFPLRIYGHMCLGILFTSSSVCGRGTTVFCVVDLSDEATRLALKMSWQDLERLPDQAAVMERLKDNLHPNVIVPFKTFNAERNGQVCTTLGAIRGFLADEIKNLLVENRVLTISLSELKRPVKYFWGVHDFVRGLRGALLGHQFLTNVGILHRDISENNIVLGLYPWEERGYLIDLDMAIIQDTEVSCRASSNQPANELPQRAEQNANTSIQQDNTKHVKALRTGTFPYISSSVLMGERHRHFDDVESFLYVLLLFFFSYAGSIPKEELLDAHEKGFTQPIGSGRLSHIRHWPQEFCDWAEGEAWFVGRMKGYLTWSPNGLKCLEQNPEIDNSLKINWPEDLQSPIRSLLQDAFKEFKRSTERNITQRTEVSHAQFIDILDKWLETYFALEDEHSQCPFDRPRSAINSED